MLLARRTQRRAVHRPDVAQQPHRPMLAGQLHEVVADDVQPLLLELPLLARPSVMLGLLSVLGRPLAEQVRDAAELGEAAVEVLTPAMLSPLAVRLGDGVVEAPGCDRHTAEQDE